MPDISLIATLVAITYSVALLCVFRILLSYRTAQGAIAWIIALLSFPYVTLFLYLLFGRPKVEGYVRARRSGDKALGLLADELQQACLQYRCGPASTSPDMALFSSLARLPSTTLNRCDLLQDGEETFRALFEALHQARDYILLNFYLVRSDHIGNRISSILRRKLGEGVRVYFIYDEVGSVGLSRRYIRQLAKAGAEVHPFGTVHGRLRRFQINFRNHRKLLVCDGRVGFVGGLNLGDEYLGAASGLAHWRDSHCRIEGPAVLALQLTFLEDWYWATHNIPRLHWRPWLPSGGDRHVVVLPSGPADDVETCTLFFMHCITRAQKRLWIASPYFVPDLQILHALQLASLRGVDVRVLIPENPDHRMVWLAAYSYLVQAERAGVGIYRYKPGFMHQKVLLVDDRFAAIGTANLDNRSMRLNFEVNAIVEDETFVEEVERMLVRDLAQSRRMTVQDYRNRSTLFRLACRAARLMAPLL